MLVPEAINSVSTYRVFEDSVTFLFPLHLKANDSAVLKGTFNWLGKSGDQFPSGEITFSIPVQSKVIDDSVEKETGGVAGKSIWQIFLICFITGLIAVLTPCVFPLIPVTVSFFLKKSKTRAEGLRNSLWYSLSIMLIYTVPTLFWY